MECKIRVGSSFTKNRKHGGAQGSGAPKGNRNAVKHGAFTKEALEHRAQMRALIREAEDLLKKLGK
jgi:uncharacterized protein YjcR